MLSSILGLVVFAIPTIAQCSRESLKQLGDAYVLAQSSGQVAAFSSDVVYSENFKTTPIKTGILSQALKIDHNRTTYDTTLCTTYTELIITDTAHPYVIGTQAHYSNGSVTKMETIITDQGDWLFNAKDTLKWALTESWNEIPAEKRDTRAVIQAAADAYCDSKILFLFLPNSMIVRRTCFCLEFTQLKSYFWVV